MTRKRTHPKDFTYYHPNGSVHRIRHAKRPRTLIEYLLGSFRKVK